MTRAEAARSACADVLSHAEELTHHSPVPGGTVIVADAEGLLAEGSFGFANLERATRMQPGHAFEIGSISKVFAGLLVSQLVDEERVSLDARAEELLPWVKLGRYGAEITVRHLLNHSAGLVAGVDALTDDLDQTWALRDLATNPPGKAFHYSNAGYVLLGLIVEELTGEPYPSTVRSRLLEPMGMTRAIPAVAHDDRERLATGYQPAADDRPWVPGDPLAPAPWFEVAAADGNIAATGADMARLIMLLLGAGDVGGRSVLSPDALTRVMTLLSPGGEPIHDPPGCPRVESSRYGLGINVEVIGGHECLSHGGGMVGYSCFLLVDRTAGLGVAVLTNANGDCTTSELLARLVRARMVAVSTGKTVEFPPVSPLLVATGDVTSPPLGRFATADGSRVLLVDRISEDGPVQVSQNGATGSLYRTGPSRFVTDLPQLRRFHLDAAPTDPPTWTHGPDTYSPADETERAIGAPSNDAPPSSWQALTGHYRSYSPWYPHLRIYPRGGRLWLATPGGVEAPGEEELVELSEGLFRIGADPAAPERLRAGPVVGGRAVSVERDACRYSRTFTD